MAYPMTPPDPAVALQKRAVLYLRVSTSEQANTDFDADGYSIRAQREACLRVAEQLGAVVIDEYPDRGESAKTAARPELQRMLRRLRAEGDVNYVIVHKVDRLARSREDDIAIAVTIRQAGAQLVSATENIDETPQGKLLHGIMATIAEFYSANLATEAKKGMLQKAKSGGTPSLAPLGYLNVRQKADGKEIRTVITDPERAPHVRWAFAAYASGNWSMKELAGALNRRGLRTRALGRYPERELKHTHVEAMLKNPYYTGVVVYDGVEYPGRHEALIDPVIFAQVQAIRESRAKSREKIHKHPHYLKGSLFCGHCGSRLGITRAKGNGGLYPYFYCLGRQSKRTACHFRYVLVSTIEDRVEARWQRVQLAASEIEALRRDVTAELAELTRLSSEERQRQEAWLTRLDRQRGKAKQAYYADALSLEEFRAEQQRIGREEADARKIMAQCSAEYDTLRTSVEDVLALLSDAHALYRKAPPSIRRMFNQAVFKDFTVYSDEEQVFADGTMTEAFAALTRPEVGSVMGEVEREADVSSEGERGQEQATHPAHNAGPATAELVAMDTNTFMTGRDDGQDPDYRAITDSDTQVTRGDIQNRAPWWGRGLRLAGLVPPSGFEPPLPP